MINFLLESAICLLVLLVFYHSFLEQEKIHLFNRFFLLFSLLVSFIIPFINLEVIPNVENFILPSNISKVINFNATPPAKELMIFSPILWSSYSFVALIMFARYIKNLLYFKKIIQNNKRVYHKNATLVLLDEKIIPHSFLNFIFINKEAYINKTIENELYHHEMTHVNQKHSYDILGIEFLKIIFWFNPIVYFYKKAIQLNHEFIADENVVKTYTDVSFYQSLLLKTNNNTNYYLASNLNYLLTKKRLIMLTKTSSKFSSFIKKAGIIPVLSFMFYFLCIDSSAQDNKKTEPHFPKEELDTYYNKTRVIIKNKDGKIITDKKYSDLSEKEKKLVPPPPPKPSKKTISETQFEDFKNKTKYAIWIDGKHVQNSELKKYKATDFVFCFNSIVYKNARSKKFPQENQANLFTENGFIEAFEKKELISDQAIIITETDKP